ncbi:hypothetical protein ACE1OC_42690 (plasmid) [Streptomyces sp. DSM 116496]|uniref:hypothetical protein n=1 Tax=Streptomyces stoeckheimensis TaxID=3344656 RepID=UPI0038B385ED
MNIDAVGENGRSVKSGGALNEGTLTARVSAIRPDVGHRPERSEELNGLQVADPGIGHDRDAVAEAAIGHPVGRRVPDVWVRAQHGPVSIQPVEEPAAVVGVQVADR